MGDDATYAAALAAKNEGEHSLGGRVCVTKRGVSKWKRCYSSHSNEPFISYDTFC